jgi:hypothetical protein
MARISARPDAGPPHATDDEEARRQALLAELAGSSWFLRGTLLQVSNRCGTPTCRCKADPPQLHGPYWQWTRKIRGKTVSVRLTEEQADLVRAWIDNARTLEDNLRALETLTTEVGERLLAAVASTPS